MSIEMMSLALDVQGLPPAEKLLLIGIANHADKFGQNAWPSMATLARYVGVSERQCRRLIRSLEARELITVDVNAGGTARTRSDHRPNLYGVTLASPREGTPSAARADMAVSAESSRIIQENKDAAAPPEPTLERALAQEVVVEWWESLSKKPSTGMIAFVKIGERLLVSGWTQDELRAGIKAATFRTKELEAWKRGQASPTEPVGPAIPGDIVKAWSEIGPWVTDKRPALDDRKGDLLGALVTLRRWGYGLGESLIRLALAVRYAPHSYDCWDPKYLADDQHRVIRFEGMPLYQLLGDGAHTATLVECMERAYNNQRWGK